MKRPNKKISIELEELVGRDNFKALTREYGGTCIYIPRISKYDRRVEYLKNVHYMRDNLENGASVDEIVAENGLTKYQRRFLEGLVKFCLNRYITSYKSLLAAVNPFCGKNTENILLLIGAAAFAALLEQYSGKRLYIPVSKESRCRSLKTKTHNSLETKIFFDLSDGLSLEETAIRREQSMKAEVEFIKNNDKVKMAVTFNTSSLGCFIVDTAYMSAAEVYERYERLYDELSPLGNVCLNPNGIIIRDENG